MKKKMIANIIMVTIIVSIAAAGILGVGYIQGWFDTADHTAVLQEVTGVIQLERQGVSYPVEKGTVLRAGDRISAQNGATAVVALGDDRIVLGSGATLTVTDPSAEAFAVQVHAGELFVNTASSVNLSFASGEVTVSHATAALSVRSGAQTVSVFRGTVGDAAAGKMLEYINGEVTVRTMQLSGLNDFIISQIRQAGKTVKLCYTDQDLNALESERQQALQELLSGQTKPTEHIHSYTVSIVTPSCTAGGYTQHSCECGDSYQDSLTAATGHSWSQWNTVQAPTTDAVGTQERACQNCDAREQRTVEKLTEGHTHSYAAETVEPTCTTNGYTLHTCVCGDSFIDNPVSAAGHQYESIVIAPTCTVQGYTKHTCSCGAAYSDSTTTAKGHSWSKWITVREATSSEEGLQERVCSTCAAKDQASIPVVDPGVEGHVYISIVCDTILNNMNDLTPGKAEFVPYDGVILPMVEAAYYEGETVFDVLKRVCELSDIQLEYSWTPLYDSYYIEGINHLYEFDCGEQSGWMYKVNEWFPNYGCSSYEVSDGDVIVWCYTCKGLGADVGDDWMAGE